MRIRRTFLAAAVAAMLCLALAGCGTSSFVIVSDDDLGAEITAEHADVDDTGSAGTLTVGEGEIILIEPALEEGRINVEFAPVSGAEDMDADSEELLAKAEPAFAKEVSGTEAVECALDAGDYMITATVTEKATGTVTIRVTGEEQAEDLDLTSLMKQVADSEITKSYEKYLPDEAFALAEVFGTEDGKAYVYLDTQEFVVLNDKAYEMSGGSGEAILHYSETEDGIHLDRVEWSADGTDHEQWIKENFPEPYLGAWEAYEPCDENGFLKLDTKMIARAEEELGVPVERENLLEIDAEKGTYEIVKTTETGTPGEDDYSFDTEVVESGSLSER